jgi:hypothetical protein
VLSLLRPARGGLCSEENLLVLTDSRYWLELHGVGHIGAGREQPTSVVVRKNVDR